MPTRLDLSVLIASLPHAAKVASTQTYAPEQAQEDNRKRTEEDIKNEKHQIQKVEKRDRVHAVKREDAREQGRRKDEHHREASDKPREHVETNASNASPWSGNILDEKI
jgi:hypothetical protein